MSSYVSSASAVQVCQWGHQVNAISGLFLVIMFLFSISNTFIRLYGIYIPTHKLTYILIHMFLCELQSLIV